MKEIIFSSYLILVKNIDDRNHAHQQLIKSYECCFILWMLFQDQEAVGVWAKDGKYLVLSFDQIKSAPIRDYFNFVLMMMMILNTYRFRFEISFKCLQNFCTRGHTSISKIVGVLEAISDIERLSAKLKHLLYANGPEGCQSADKLCSDGQMMILLSAISDIKRAECNIICHQNLQFSHKVFNLIICFTDIEISDRYEVYAYSPGKRTLLCL